MSVDHEARQALIVLEETVTEVIEAVAKLSGNIREAEEAKADVIADVIAKGFKALADRIETLADRVGMLELDRKQGGGNG